MQFFNTTLFKSILHYYIVQITGKVESHELVRCLDNGIAQQIDVKKRLRRVAKKDKVLDVPLDRHELEKVVVVFCLLHSSIITTKLTHCAVTA